MNFYNIILVILVIHQSIQATVHIVCSAALNKRAYSYRKKQYHRMFTNLAKMGYSNFYIFEALAKKGPTFLDNYCQHIYYATNNDSKYFNHGINEARTLLEMIKHYNFAPDDMLIKLTGRYTLLSDHFLKFTHRNTQYDAIVKYKDNNQVYTSCFAMKCKHLVAMIESFNFDEMEDKFIILEEAVARYIEQNQKTMRVCTVNKLDIKADYYGSSCPTATGIEIQ